MLACYPIAATQENWLHETLIELVHVLHQRLDDGREIAQTQAQWLSLLPGRLSDAQKKALRNLTGVRDKLFAYLEVVQSLSVAQRNDILTVLNNQNSIAELLSGQLQPKKLLPGLPTVHARVLALFAFAFGKLTDLKIRERQYELVFDALDDNFCPFCGIERMMHPDETAQDLDHYLAKSIYPFAAANMRNLVPMCRVCNRDYKKDVDILFDDNGKSRLVFDPYDCQPVTVSLLDSRLDSGEGTPMPSWQIDFELDCEQAETWDQVFSIRTRYRRDVLDTHFSRWLGDFKTKCHKERSRGLFTANMSEAEVREKLAYYHQDKEEIPTVGPGFLEPKVFAFLLKRFDHGDWRVVQLIRDAVLGTDEAELGL